MITLLDVLESLEIKKLSIPFRFEPVYEISWDRVRIDRYPILMTS